MGFGAGWSHLAGKKKEGGDEDGALQAKVGDGHLLRQKSPPASALGNCLTQSPKVMPGPAPHHPPAKGAGGAQPSSRSVRRHERSSESPKRGTGHTRARCVSPKPVILTDKNTPAKLYRVLSASRWGWGKKIKVQQKQRKENSIFLFVLIQIN